MTTSSNSARSVFHRSLLEKEADPNRDPRSLQAAAREYSTSHRLSSIPCASNPLLAASSTILPSPEPRSTILLLLAPAAAAVAGPNASMTLLTCWDVAGTKGRQARRRAGVTKGRHTALRATAAPPEINQT